MGLGSTKYPQILQASALPVTSFVRHAVTKLREAIRGHASLLALAIMAACFRNDGRSESKAVAEFLDLTASTLRAELDRPETLQ